MSRVTSNIFCQLTSGLEIWGGQNEILFFLFLGNDLRQTLETCRDNCLSIFPYARVNKLFFRHFRSIQEVSEKNDDFKFYFG